MSSTGLSLSVGPGKFVVCKLPADSPFPSWINESTNTAVRESRKFYSITRTDEELSIVCPKEWLPGDVNTNADVSIEDGWRIIKVEGPLDFALTGILSSLAKPLADAGVAIFAISTFDTDYLLLKEVDLSTGVKALQQEGHTIESTEAPPRDGPETTRFEVDPLVMPLAHNKDHETFGLVLVAGWPPRDDIRQAYEKFRELVPDCFAQDDVKDAVYLYPSSALHVTVANFRPIQKPTPPDYQAVLTRHVQVIVEKAFASWSSSLPSSSRESSIVASLAIDRAQLGRRAGILLWKDETGQIARLRDCVRTACKDHLNRLESMPFTTQEEKDFVMEALGELVIPSIIHSTFLRFHQEPKGSVSSIQQKFQDAVVPKLPMLMPELPPLTSVALVAERRPYMHIPNDKDHVVCTFPSVNEG